MPKRKFNKEDETFIQGMLVALSVVALHDAETIFREIVDLQGEDDLVWVARKHGDMVLSGLSKYGYGRRNKDDYVCDVCGQDFGTSEVDLLAHQFNNQCEKDLVSK